MFRPPPQTPQHPVTTGSGANQSVPHTYLMRLRSQDGAAVGPFSAIGSKEEVLFSLKPPLSVPPYGFFQVRLLDYSIQYSANQINTTNSWVDVRCTDTGFTGSFQLEFGIQTRTEICTQLQTAIRALGEPRWIAATVVYDSIRGVTVWNTHDATANIELLWNTGPNTINSAAQICGFRPDRDYTDINFARNTDSLSPLPMDALPSRFYSINIDIAMTDGVCGANSPLSTEIGTVPLPEPESRYQTLSGNGDLSRYALFRVKELVQLRVFITNERGEIQAPIVDWNIVCQVATFINPVSEQLFHESLRTVQEHATDQLPEDRMLLGLLASAPPEPPLMMPAPDAMDDTMDPSLELALTLQSLGTDPLAPPPQAQQ